MGLSNAAVENIIKGFEPKVAIKRQGHLYLAAEKVFKKLDCPYALIPTPKSMRSGCSNSICFPLYLKDIIEDLLDAGVVIMGSYEATEDGFVSIKW
ncbi:MAG: DUF3343 domain-containing protein [Desulfosporosinus sp.]|nr:DUF3343 domain-containing protein [Desulfosporosinus sp.]